MAKIKEFNRHTLKALRTETNSALEKIGKKLGVTIQMGNISFSASECRTKLEYFIPSGDNTGMNAEQQKDFNGLKNYGHIFGVTEKDFGKTFTSNGEVFKLTGIAPKRHKYPVIAENLMGKAYVFPPSVLEQFKK